jgi:PilZ domain
MDGGDQRQYPRFGLGLPVKLLFSDRGLEEGGELQDISRGGCFFKSAAKVEVDRKIEIVFSLSRGSTCHATGHVIRTTAYQGFAVLFDDVSDSTFDFIRDLTVLPQDKRAKFLTSVLNPEIQIG